ncbi:MAG: hemolysin III family protein [Candidatus Promineifilaceae bacterium]|nr:hemolysin III family protein [Candidatus Promineifilaceae bacterium]
MRKLERLFLEPWSALTHLGATILAALGLALLVALTHEQPRKMLSVAIYGTSLCVLFLSSTLLHSLKVEPRLRNWLNRFDHGAIFLLIAGTYTPIVYNLFPRHWRLPLLAAIWAVAAVGITYKLTSIRIHGFFNVSIYALLGWGGIVPLSLALPVERILSQSGLLLLLLGGLIYSLGFVIYYRERPDPWPGVFGHHEIWHLFVIGGSLCHYFFILFYVVRPGG